jgi:hypothetical protein
MNNDPRASEDPDLDTTDTLPLIGSEPIAPELSDATVAKFAFAKTATLDLPRLAKTLRSVEARIEQQGADHASLARSFERTLEMEEAAVARASALAAELAAVQAELNRAREALAAAEKRATETGAAFEAQHARLEDAAREVAWHAEEARSLRDLLATRDATIANALESLRERDEEVAALRSELARLQAQSTASQPAVAVPAAGAALAEHLADLPIDADTATLRERIAEQERRLAAQAGEILSLQAAATTDQEEKAVLLAHLQAARHGPPPSDPIDQRNALVVRLERSEAQAARLMERLETAIERLNTRAALGAGNPAAGSAARHPGQAGPDAGSAGIVSTNPAVSPNPNGRGVATPDFDNFFAKDPAPGHEQEPRLGTKPAARSGQSDERFHGSDAAVAPIGPGESLRRSGEINAFAATCAPDADPNAAPAVAAALGAFPEARSLAQFLRIDGAASQAYALRGRMLVGRSPDAELHIDSSTVSRQHAILECDSFGVLIEDTQSTNGTYVNGVKVSRQRLKNGDQVKIGEACFRFLAAKTSVSTH